MARWSIWLGPIVLLAIALLDMPYGYYQLLRVVIFCASAYLALTERKRQSGLWLWAFIASALIYNPVAKLALGRDLWGWVNLATIVLFAAHFMKRRMNNIENEEGVRR
jgi:hypothetical protein